MNYRSVWLSMILLVSGCAQVGPATQVFTPATADARLSESDAVQLYLAGRELDPVEGIWNWADGSYQVVITRNNTGVREDFKYIGILMKSRVSGWRPGQVKLLLDETSSQETLDGIYYGSNQMENRMSFTMPDPDSIETASPIYMYGEPLKVVLVRSNRRTAGNIGADVRPSTDVTLAAMQP
jgi:hypothetical protein